MYNSSIVHSLETSVPQFTGKVGQKLNEGIGPVGSTPGNNERIKLRYTTSDGQSIYVGTSSTPIRVDWEWVPKLTHQEFDSVEKVGEVRYGNPSTVRLEIRYGKDNSLFTLDSVYVDYIKSPQYIRITQE